MKHIATALTITALFLSACNKSKPTEVADEDETQDSVATKVETQEPERIAYTETDVRMHGLLGKVRHVTSSCYTTYEEDSELKESYEFKSYELCFDKWGHVITDPWGNEYGYDAERNYYRGNHTYTKVKRDSKGRIVNYTDEEPNQDNESNCTYEFKYSDSGQLVAVSVSGWNCEWNETITYKDNSLFPESSTRRTANRGEEGEEGETITTTNYKYNSLDGCGNWTDRTCIVNELITTTVINEETQEAEEKTANETTIYIEKRAIEYFDE